MRPEIIKLNFKSISFNHLITDSCSLLDLMTHLSDRITLNIDVSKSRRKYCSQKINRCGFSTPILFITVYFISYRAKKGKQFILLNLHVDFLHSSATWEYFSNIRINDAIDKNPSSLLTSDYLQMFFDPYHEYQFLLKSFQILFLTLFLQQMLDSRMKGKE